MAFSKFLTARHCDFMSIWGFYAAHPDEFDEFSKLPKIALDSDFMRW